jgi:hypothetical protein
VAQLNEELTYLLKKAIEATFIAKAPWDDEDNKAHQVFIGALLQKSPWKKLLTTFEITARLYVTTWTSCRQHHINPNLGDSRRVGDLGNSALVDEIYTKIKNEFLEKLPISYTAYFQLPRFPHFDSEIELSPSLTLATHSNHDFDSALQIPQSHTYLLVKVAGIQSLLADFSANEAAISKLKHFITLGIASEAFHLAGTPFETTTAGGFTTDAVLADCFIVETGRNEKLQMHVPGVGFRGYVARLAINEEVVKVSDDPGPGETLITTPIRKASNPTELGHALPAYLSNALALDKIPDDNKDLGPIRTAMEWHFDAETTHNETVELIQRFIGIESLLGVEGETRGITDKLATRYAYLLGKTRGERERMVSSFETAYNLRSQLVHGRTARLNNSQRKIAGDVKRILMDLIAHEAAEIAKSKAANPKVH